MELKKFKGCPYPIEPHPMGYLRTQWGVDQIKSDMLMLLLTNPGERVMLPKFGTPLKKLFFEPNDTLLQSQAQEMIVASLNAFEPRVAIKNVQVVTNIKELTDEAYRVDPPADESLIGATLGTKEASFDDIRSDSDDEHILGIRILFVDPNDINEVQELVLQVPIT